MSLSLPDPTGKNGWYNKPLSVYVNAWDNGKGISDVQISLGGGTWYKRSLTIRKDGTYKVIGRATDKAGNIATTWRIVHVDMTAPTVEFIVPATQGIGKWYVKPIKLSLNGEDNLSGVYQTSLTAEGIFDPLSKGLLDAREMAVAQDQYQQLFLGNVLSKSEAEITIQQSGEYQVNGYVEDIAGNRAPVDISISMDLTAPKIQVQSPTQFFGDIKLIGLTEDQDSGISQVWVDYGGGWRRAEINQGNWSSLWQTADLKDGDYTIEAKAMDKAGNIASTSYPVTVLNHTWPIAAFCGVLLSLGLTALYDPRRKALREFTLSVARYSHMDRSARELERKMK